jgi:hypothetical protein
MFATKACAEWRQPNQKADHDHVRVHVNAHAHATADEI